MDDVGGQGGIAAVDPMGCSSVMEDSCALEIDAAPVENEALDEEVVNKARQNLIISEVGMTFQSEEKAYEMYNTYAGKIGFSVRKSRTKHRKDGSLSQKYMVCSSQGQRENESSQKDITRTGCDARVQFSISKEGIWTVQKNFNAGPSSSMDAPFLQSGYANSTMAHFNLTPEPSAMAAPYIPGGYTSLLMGVDQDAIVQTTVRKLHFDGVQNHESM